ncbi:MAG TPA: TIGR00645 family protein [Magnetospirillaceae bacterium]|jgi:uncharacterized protein (TIGR00645 family)
MTGDSTPRHTPVERAIEHTLFASRWILAPVYLGLAIGLLVVLAKFVIEAYELITHAYSVDIDAATVGVLSLIDLSLMGSLILMVMFAGYENFVSKIDVGSHKDRPSWMGHIDFSDLKLKLIAAIVAISAIRLLENFMNIDTLSDRDLAWSAGIHAIFVVSAVLLALTDRLTSGKHP